MSRYNRDDVVFSLEQAESFERLGTFPKVESIVNMSLNSVARCADAPINIELMPLSTIEAAINIHSDHTDYKIGVLNFASFKHPGGGYKSGMKAQEEDLCHCTNLYAELAKHQDWYDSHASKLNHGYYQNESILSKNITVYARGICDFLTASERFSIDVLTCAAPNWSNTLRYSPQNVEQAIEATKDRIDYVMHIFSSFNYDVLILGAYGCGVFMNDPSVVAKAFKDSIQKYLPSVKTIIFAIPDKTSVNFKTFSSVFGKSC